ncbi:MAG: M61 family peptidase [Candidatus Baltobacteraceae bacterium]
MKFAAAILLTAALLAGPAVQAQTADDAYAPETPTAGSYATQAEPMTLVLDARSAERGLMYSRMTIPVRPGAFSFVYPKWIPGEHGPTGPLGNVTEIRVSANGHALSWRRDVTDLYKFHVEVPAGVSAIDAGFTVVTNARGDTMSGRNVAVINWNRDLFYQAGINSHEYYVKPSIILPHGWDYASALYGAKRTGDRIDFAVAPLNLLVDSPLDMGRYYKHYLLWKSGSASQWLDIFADKPQDLDISPKLIAAYKHMPRQAFALYGSRHWTWYHSLLALSDAIGFQGIEHHQSSDDRADDNFMTDPVQQLSGGDLVTHELSHSWNGKYRRPYDLTTLNFQIVQRTDLLWVYEGMNQYLGDLLSFRAGIRQPKDYPEYLATVYAALDSEPGRLTTPLIDLTTGAPHFYTARGDYGSLRRNAGDFYSEGELIWLDADTIIREKTGGKKSIDDFLHAFTAPEVTGPITKTYTREDVEQLLNATAPYDWHNFFDRYVYQVSVHPPNDDLARAGWKLVYSDKPNKFLSARRGGSINEWYSFGTRIGSDGSVQDVRESSPAWNAGLAPGMKLVAVNGQAWDPGALDYAMKTTQHSHGNLVFIANNGGAVGTYTVNYHGGQRYPHLVRITGTPDMLAKIMAPR